MTAPHIVDPARLLGEALAGPLYAIGEPAAADMLIAVHARNDQPGDRHYQTPAILYVVPVDPMDMLQCDSCQ